MTVGDLRRAVEALPGDMPVYVITYESVTEVCGHAAVVRLPAKAYHHLLNGDDGDGLTFVIHTRDDE